MTPVRTDRLIDAQIKAEYLGLHAAVLAGALARLSIAPSPFHSRQVSKVSAAIREALKAIEAAVDAPDECEAA